jgi:cytochrome c-type biogenesis protein CcmH/NrfF
MLKRMLWVLPLVFALASATVDAQEQARRRRRHRAPEFDPNASGAAAALLVGGTLLLSERCRRNKSESE